MDAVVMVMAVVPLLEATKVDVWELIMLQERRVEAVLKQRKR